VKPIGLTGREGLKRIYVSSQNENHPSDLHPELQSGCGDSDSFMSSSPLVEVPLLPRVLLRASWQSALGGFLLMSLLLPASSQAGVWETLARGSNRVFNERCSQRSTQPGPDAGSGDAQPGPRATPDPNCSLHQDPARALTQNARLISQETYLAALADERAKTDQCASDFIRQLQGGPARDRYVSDLADKTRMMADVMVKIQSTMHRLSQLSGQTPALRERREREAPPLREELRRAQAALAAIENSIPLGTQSDIQAVIRSHMQKMVEPMITLGAISGARPAEMGALDESKFRSDLSAALGRAQASIDGDIRTLREGVASGGTRLDRATRESLAQDRDLIESFLARNPGLRSGVGPVACEVDAAYGRGAEARDQALLVGSIGLTVASLGVGAVARGGAAAVSLSTPARLASARGVISLRSARILSSAAMGVDSVAGLQQVDTACFQNQRGTRVSATGPSENRCESFSLESMEGESCVLAASLTALGVGLGSEAAQRLAARALPGGRRPASAAAGAADAVPAGPPAGASVQAAAREVPRTSMTLGMGSEIRARPQEIQALRNLGTRQVVDRDTMSVLAAVEPDRRFVARVTRGDQTSEMNLTRQELLELSRDSQVNSIRVERIEARPVAAANPVAARRIDPELAGALRSDPPDHVREVLVQYESGQVATFRGNRDMIERMAADRHVMSVKQSPDAAWIRPSMSIRETQRGAGVNHIEELRTQLREGAIATRGADVDVRGARVYHGTIREMESSVRERPLNVGTGFGGRGLYLAQEGERDLAANYAGHAATAAANRVGNIRQVDDASRIDREQIVMVGRLNPERNLRVGSFEVGRDIFTPDLARGRLPIDWDNDPRLRRLLEEEFDVLEIRNARANGLNLNSNRFFVVHERAGANAVLWDETQLARPPAPRQAAVPQDPPVNRRKVEDALNTWNESGVASRAFLPGMTGSERQAYATRILGVDSFRESQQSVFRELHRDFSARADQYWTSPDEMARFRRENAARLRQAGFSESQIDLLFDSGAITGARPRR
jgi:hypothetical protein